MPLNNLPLTLDGASFDVKRRAATGQARDTGHEITAHSQDGRTDGVHRKCGMWDVG